MRAYRSATTGWRPTRRSLRHDRVHGTQSLHGHASVPALATTATQSTATTVSTKSHEGLTRTIVGSGKTNAAASARAHTKHWAGTFVFFDLFSAAYLV